MKNKVLIFFIVFSAIITNCFAQLCSTNSNNPNNLPLFDWTQDNTVNWYFDIAKPPQAIHLPYFCNGISQNIDDGCNNENLSFYEQIRSNPNSMDILPADGWELLSYNFGSATTINTQPYLMLYNKYTAKVKLFVLAVASNSGITQTRASVQITWASGSSTTKLLSHANTAITPVSYNGYNTGSIYSLNDIATLQGISGSNPVPQYQWLGAEWVAAYDPCTCNLSSPPQLSFNIQYFDPTAFDAQTIGDGENANPPALNCYGNTTGKTLNTAINNKGSFSFGEGYGAQTNSILKSPIDFSSYASNITDNLTDISAQGSGATGNLNTGNDFVNSVANSINIANNLGNSSSQSTINSQVINALNSNGSTTIAKTLGANGTTGGIEANSYIANAAGLVDFFVAQDGDNSSNPLPPVAYNVHDKINFTIVNPPVPPYTDPTYNTLPEGTVLNTPNNVILPGSNSSYSSTDNAPVYNNVLGVFNLFSLPGITAIKLNVNNLGLDPAQANTGGDRCNQNMPGALTFMDYKLSSPLQYVMNPSSDLTVESIDAAFVFEYNNTITPNYNHVFQKYNPIFITPSPQITSSIEQYIQTQVPYYPGMNANFYVAPQTSCSTPSYTDWYTGDGNTSVMPMSEVLSSMSKVGLELEYQSPGYKSVDPYANTENSIIRFRTKYVPLQCFHNLDFILCGGGYTPKTSIKLYCKFKRPDGKLVTAIYTYDISSTLQYANTTATTTTGVQGTYYFYSADPSTTFCGSEKCSGQFTHLTFSGLYVYGPYNNAHYGNQSGTYTSGSNGCISQSSINISNNTSVYYSQTAYPNNDYNTISSMDAVNIGNSVTLNNYYQPNNNISPDEVVEVLAMNDIAVGTNAIVHSPTSFYSGDKVNFSDNASIRGYSPTHGAVGWEIGETKIYAKNEVSIQNNTANATTQITGEVTIGTNKSLPIYSILNSGGCDGSDPISNYNEIGSVDNSRCSAFAERLMASNTKKPAITQPTKKADMTVTKLGTVASIKLGIYPNPTSGVIYLNLNAQNEGNLIVNINTLGGTQVMQNRFSCNDGTNSFKINLSGLTQGVYFINITDENGIVIKNDKIVLMPQ